MSVTDRPKVPVDDLPALARALRKTVKQHPHLREPAANVASNAAKLAKNFDDRRLRATTIGMIDGLHVALGVAQIASH